MKYAKTFKQSVVQQFYLSGISQRQYAQKVGIHRETLDSWLKIISPDLKSAKKENIFIDKNIHHKDKNWTANDKIWAVFTFENIEKKERGIFLRKNGLYSCNLKQWKHEMLLGLLVGKKELHCIKKYKKNIESQKAIIELQKKTQSIFAVEEKN